MLTRIIILLIYISTFSSSVISNDTIPPTGKLENPKHFTTITGNIIKICVDAQDKESGIKEVLFYANYKQYGVAEREKRYGRHKIFIGKVTEPPYELVWDITNIPDQDIWGLVLYCTIEDNAGNFNRKKIVRENIVIDRNR